MSDDYIEEYIRRIEEAPICEPGAGQHVGPCHWSRTGWAVWNDQGCCTCKPAIDPQAQLSPEDRP
jgi:hypothetical protein